MVVMTNRSRHRRRGCIGLWSNGPSTGPRATQEASVRRGIWLGRSFNASRYSQMDEETLRAKARSAPPTGRGEGRASAPCV
jgi:hypothetical protein